MFHRFGSKSVPIDLFIKYQLVKVFQKTSFSFKVEFLVNYLTKQTLKHLKSIYYFFMKTCRPRIHVSTEFQNLATTLFIFEIKYFISMLTLWRGCKVIINSNWDCTATHSHEIYISCFCHIWYHFCGEENVCMQTKV